MLLASGLPFVPSDAILVTLQAALVLVPGSPHRRAASPLVGLAVPAGALAAGVAIARAAGGASFLAVLAAVATPLLAAAAGPLRGWPRPWLPALAVPPLYAAAWLEPRTLGGEAAGVLLIAGACLAVTALVAGLAPPSWLAAGLVLLVALDCTLVWGDRQVGPATQALAAAAPPSVLGHPLPALQQVQLGSAQMGWLDLAAPALLGLVVARRVAAFVVTGVAAAVWSLLLLATPLIAATPPVLAGLAAGRLRRCGSR